jgi:hypothetical protein
VYSTDPHHLLSILFYFIFFLKKSLRGINADLIICEEWAFMPIAVWQDVVIPLFGRESAVVIGISTPLDSANFFSKLLTKRHPRTGEPIFLTAVMELACDRCKKNNRAHLCRHRMKYLPPWKSRDKQDIMDMMLSDQVTTIVRENMGVIIDEGNSFIEKKFIDRWYERELFVPKVGQAADTILLAIDPNGGDSKTCSEMAIVAIGMQWDSTVVSVHYRGPMRSNPSARASPTTLCLCKPPPTTPGPEEAPDGLRSAQAARGSRLARSCFSL